MKIIDKTSHKEINPALASADLLLSGTCWIRQKGGEGNSLGRMIFRFPNNLSIYLHDTNNREVFTRQWRYLSHGCIRLERPLDLATFLLPEYDELTVDKMRISIDLPPLTEKGMKLAKQTKRPIGTYHFNPQTPLFIVYYTLFPNAQGEICSYPDIYGYDELIRKKLSMYF
jgi:murein L,D-transpeptidase YcbB/YkuD